MSWKVANPHKHPRKIPILQNGERTWFEGDVYDGDPAAWLIEQGYIVEVKDDGEKQRAGG